MLDYSWGFFLLICRLSKVESSHVFFCKVMDKRLERNIKFYCRYMKFYFHISFLLFSKTPSTQFQTKFWMDKNLYGSTFRLHWVHWNELGIFLTWSEVGQDFWHVQFQFYEDSCKHLNPQVFVQFVQWKPGASSHALDEKVIPVVTSAAKICTDSC